MLLVLALAPLAASVIASQTVYKTIVDGVTVFSDTPPSGTGPEATEVFVLRATPPADDDLLEQRLAEMRDTTDRMAGDRLAREAERQRKATVRNDTAATLASSRGQNSNAAPLSLDSTLGTGVWTHSSRPVFGYRPRFGREHRNGHGRRYSQRYQPGQRTPPVAPPGWSVIRPGNSQLMRPIVSSRP